MSKEGDLWRSPTDLVLKCKLFIVLQDRVFIRWKLEIHKELSLCSLFGWSLQGVNRTLI